MPIRFLPCEQKNTLTKMRILRDSNNLLECAYLKNYPDLQNYLHEKTQYLKKFQIANFTLSLEKDFSTFYFADLGQENQINLLDFTILGGKIAHYVEKLKETTISFHLPDFVCGQMDQKENIMALCEGILLNHYAFDHYKSHKKKPQEIEYIFYTDTPDIYAQLLEEKKALLDGVSMARDLVTMPSNILYPASYSEKIKELEKYGLKVTILDEDKMTELKMGALLAVGQGSEKASKAVIIEWQGDTDSDNKPVALVGKGVTFDTGGISLKPAPGMEEMKTDMGGSAAVVGTLLTLAKRKARVNVIGLVGLVENMPSGGAQRPGDVITSMSGQTIEVLNTDAEGRLVLADMLWYCHTYYNPACIIDLATLTGAMVIALGSDYTGLFSNNTLLKDQLCAAGQKTGERVWPMPLDPCYDKKLDCDIADMKNISGTREAGSITAAQFLQRFVKDYPWVHLDIAGTAWAKQHTDFSPKGATGIGVRLLNQFIADYYENKKDL